MKIESIDRVQEELQFVSKYREELAARRKHGTIREGKRVPARMSLPVRITESMEDLGEVEINEIRWLKLTDIDTPEIMKHEFPREVEELRKDLFTLYPRLTDSSWVTFFRFRFTDETEGPNTEQTK